MGDDIFESVYATILRRDTTYDGIYYAGIVTTGIFCRPSCRSRTPKPENVRVYGSIEAAKAAGFRACKRCRPEQPGPNGPDAALAGAVSSMIGSRYADRLTLADMASRLNVSPFHLQRVFKRVTGTTPAQALLRKRLEKALELLRQGDEPIADIAAAVGFSSASHFTFVFHRSVGTSPQHYRGNIRNEASNPYGKEST